LFWGFIAAVAGKKKKNSPAVKKSGVGDMRDKINVLALIEALEQHVLGEKKMTSTQVSAALALLKKTLPDLSEPARRPLPETESPQAHEDALQELE
jgi:hypothetical protein